MEKLKVNKLVGEGLKDLLGRSREDYSFEFIINTHAEIKRNEREEWCGSRECEASNQLSLSEMAHVIYVGYEVEESQEEKLAKLFKKTECQPVWKGFEVRMFMVEALSIAGIEVAEDYWKDLL